MLSSSRFRSQGNAPPAPEPPPPPPEPAQPGFHWLQLRITEERERREREAMVLDRLPRAVEELRTSLLICVDAYNTAFGLGAIELESEPLRMRILVRESVDGRWREQSHIEIMIVPAIPGFQIDRAGSPLLIEVGMLPGDKLFYRDREKDQYLTMEDVTRIILDRAFFPKLGE